jgi:hypothetical protein
MTVLEALEGVEALEVADCIVVPLWQDDNLTVRNVNMVWYEVAINGRPQGDSPEGLSTYVETIALVKYLLG